MEEYIQGYIILILVSCLLSAVTVRAVLTKKRAQARLPPSPPALPIIGHLHLLGRLPHQALHKLSLRYGPLIHLSLGSIPCIVASSPETAKEFLKTSESSFLNRPEPGVLNFLSYPSSSFTFSGFGPYWKFMKTLCMSQLLGGQTLDQLLPIRREELKRLMDSTMRKARAKESIHVGGELSRMTNSIISRMLMGRRCAENDDEAEEIRKLVIEATEALGRFHVPDYIWLFKSFDLQGFLKKGKEIHEKFDKIVETVIDEHQESRKGKGGGDHDRVKDLVDILLEISEDESLEIRLTRENIKAFILDVFLAGTDTAAITIEWAMSELINHPNIMNRARQELDFIVGKSRLVEESDISELPYIQAIVKETLRLYPSVPLIPRESSKYCKINGYDIPEKTRLLVNVWAIGRDPNIWEDPLMFKPERFLGMEGNGKSQMDLRGQNFHFLPFGSGRRSCPGISFALLVVQTSLAAMIQCFNWKVDGKDGIVDMEEGPGVTLPRAHPLVCVPLSRLSPMPF